jgi:hypothetical protein
MTFVQGGFNMLCVPDSCGKKDAVGAFIEAMASESYKKVIPAYFEVAMKVKYARAETSGKMLDIIREGIVFDFAYLFGWNLSPNPYDVIIDLMGAKNNNFASWYEKNIDKINKSLEKFVAAIEAME